MRKLLKILSIPFAVVAMIPMIIFLEIFDEDEKITDDCGNGESPLKGDSRVTTLLHIES